jgi:hypothetical protein
LEMLTNGPWIAHVFAMRDHAALRHASLRLYFLFPIAMLAACQAASNTPQPSGNNDRVMNLWSTYRTCMASSDFEEVHRASDELRIVRKQSEWHAGKHGSPAQDSTQYSADAPSRLAVDVQAMAASCALHAGDIASEHGRENIARQLYSEVLSYQDPAYSFYVGQARSRLAGL